MIQVWAVEGIPEVVAGDEIAGLIIQAISTRETTIQDGDIVVTSKIVSKAEGRSVQATDREDAITSQTVRVVATRGNTRIVENPRGLVLAAAGWIPAIRPRARFFYCRKTPMPAPAP